MIHEMLDKAFMIISDDSELIFHSDQGWHYRQKIYMNKYQLNYKKEKTFLKQEFILVSILSFDEKLGIL